MEKRAFDFYEVPVREPKPRKKGLNIGTDTGWPLHAQEDWLDSHHDVIDLAKFADHYGLAARYPEGWFRKKLDLYRRYSIPTFTGGITYELAQLQGKAEMLFHRMAALGFSGVEVSEDVLPDMPATQRTAVIKQATGAGLLVFTEIGKKFGDKPLETEDAVRSILADLEAGARKVTLEAAEIQVLSRHRPQTLVEIAERVGLEHIVFELKPGPWPELPVWLFRALGPDVNVENIAMEEALVVERMRFGMCREAEYTFLREKGGRL